MASQASFSVRFRDRNSHLHERPKEWEPYTLELTIPVEYWRDARLTIQGEQQSLYLASLESNDVVCADWPRSAAGHYILRCSWAEVEHERTISIMPEKLSLSSFNRLLDDLEQTLPAGVALALKRAGALTGIALPRPAENTLAGEIARLRRALLGHDRQQGLLSTLVRIGGSPHQVLDQTERWVPRWQTRRPHPTGLQKALARPHDRASDSLPNQFLETHVTHSVDTYENRILKLFTRQVEFGLHRVSQQLIQHESVELFSEIQSLLTQLRAARRNAEFLKEVSMLSESPSAVSMVLLRRPDYREMFAGFLEFRHSPSVRFQHPMLDSPLANLPTLYQMWGTLVVLQVLVEAAPQFGFRVTHQGLVKRDIYGLCVDVLPRSKPIVELRHSQLKRTIRIWAERSYGPNSAPLRSISYRQRPDLSIEFVSDEATTIMIFDPKYKLRSETVDLTDELPGPEDQEIKPIKADVDKMHTYRDAIRDRDGNRVVSLAATLYPGPTHWFGDDVAALTAIPGKSSQLLTDLEGIFARYLRQFSAA